MVDEARIIIFVPVANRLELAQHCIQTVIDGMDPKRDAIFICADGIDHGFIAFLHAMTDSQVQILRGPRIGIECQRREHFTGFIRTSPTWYTHLYLTDADAIHDPNWRTALLTAQFNHGGLPVCGYNTEAHERIPGNTLAMGSDHILRATAPGISYLLTRAQALTVAKWLTHDTRDHWMWDWTVPAVLGNKFLITRPSVVDHIGFGGMHHPPEEGYNGGDRATEPTPWLVHKRNEIINALLKSQAVD